MELSFCEKKGPNMAVKDQSELAQEEIIHLSLYDQSDPGNLFLCTIDDKEFNALLDH